MRADKSKNEALISNFPPPMTLEAHCRELLEHTQEAVWVISNSGKIEFANKRMADLLGYTIPALLALSLYDLAGKEKFYLIEEFLAQRASGEAKNFELKLQHKNKTWLWVFCSACTYSKKDGSGKFHFDLVTDISSRKHTEDFLVSTLTKTDEHIHFHRWDHSQKEKELLREIETRKLAQKELENRKILLRSFFELSPVIMGILELDGKEILTVRINRAAKIFLDLPEDTTDEEINARPKPPKEASNLWLEHIHVCIQTKKAQTFEYERNFDKYTRHLAVTINQTGISEKGNPLFSYVAVDITHQKKLEHSLLENEQRLRLAQDFAQIGTWDVDTTTQAIQWSDSMRTIFDLKQNPAPKTTEEFLHLIHPSDRQAVFENIQSSIKNGTDHIAEFRIFDSSGKIRWIEGRGYHIFNANGSAVRTLGVAINITERKMAEEALREKTAKIYSLSKLSSLGEMAAGMAHEINNPLTVIHGSAALAQRELRAKKINREKIIKAVETITSTGNRISKIIEGLRLFARDGSGDPFERALVKTLLNDTISLCAELIKKKKIELRLPVIPQNLALDCRPVQVTQILLNLLNNACDAVSVVEDHKWISVDVVEHEQEIEFNVRDSGPGLPADLESRVFEPFFTTKAPGAGTGLGLSISKGIAESHSGTLSFIRDLEGSCFRLSLPKSQQKIIPNRKRN